MPAHLRTGAYGVYGQEGFPDRVDPAAPLTYEENVRRIAAAKARFLQTTRGALDGEPR
jgi:hypothetical protein